MAQLRMDAVGLKDLIVNLMICNGWTMEGLLLR